MSHLGSRNSLMIQIIPGFLLRLPLKALSLHAFQSFQLQILCNKVPWNVQSSSVVILEAARKCAKLAQVSSELAVSPPVRGKYVNCAKWKCTWNALDAIGKYCCSSKVFGKYCVSKVFGKYCVSKVFGKYCISKVFGQHGSLKVFGFIVSWNPLSWYKSTIVSISRWTDKWNWPLCLRREERMVEREL